MKKLLILLMLFCCFAAVGCLIDDPDIADEEDEVLVSVPDAGEDNIITPCDPVADPHCERSDPGPGGGAGGGGGGGGGGEAGNDPACFGSNNNWCRLHQRCERTVSCTHPSGNPDFICHRSHGDGECLCIYYPPYLAPSTETLLQTLTVQIATAKALVDDTEANIIVPGCDAPESDPGRVCDGNGGGGSGTGGGGGSSGGGGTCTPGQPGCSGPVNCPVGHHWDTVRRRCIFDRAGQSCHSRPPFEGQVCLYDFQGTCTCGYPEQFPPGFPYEI